MNLIPSKLLLNKHKQLWLWPTSCNNHPKTLSFRATTDQHDQNPNKKLSVEVPEVDQVTTTTTLGSFFTNSSETTASVSTESDEETVVREARSDRLFFEPDSSTSSILEAQGSGMQCTSEVGGDSLKNKESVAVVMESENPYVDFRKSMMEMVEIHGLKSWDCLEELFGWYLRMNHKNNHEFIVGAFIDLLAGISGDDGRGGGGGGGGGGDGVLFLDHTIASCSSVGSTFSSHVSSPNGN